MTVESLAPILVVDAIEPCLPFWTERLGFSISIQVPHGDGVGFVILSKDGVRVMYQSRASLQSDMKDLPEEVYSGSTLLYLRVSDLTPLEVALADVQPVLPRRTTAYGKVEIGYREPGGHVVVFAAPPSVQN